MILQFQQVTIIVVFVKFILMEYDEYFFNENIIIFIVKI